MSYPTPELTSNETGNILNLFGYVQHTATDGLFFPLMLLAVWIIAIIGSISEGRQFSLAFIFSTFITAIIAIPLVFINLLSANYMYFLFVLLGIGVIAMYLDRSPGI